MTDDGEKPVVPQWKLERIALGELPGPAPEAELAVLKESNREILATHPPEKIVAEIERRRHARLVKVAVARRYLLWTGATMCAAAALLLFWRAEGTAPGPSSEPEVTRLKGARPTLIVKRKRNQGSERLADGAHVDSGDLIQLQYVAADARYGAIFSIDGRGDVTQHLPAEGPASQALEGKDSLRFAYQLDDAPNFERFVFVTSKEPLAGDRVVAAVRALAADSAHRKDGKLELPAGVSQTWLLLNKGNDK